MALNTLKCNHLTPLSLKGLKYKSADMYVGRSNKCMWALQYLRCTQFQLIIAYRVIPDTLRK